MFGHSKTWSCLWLLLVCWAVGLKATSSSEEEREIGDIVAPREMSPWQVSIQKGHSHKCSGAILGKDWVVTTARCLRGANIRNYRLVVGTQTLGAKNRFIVSYLIEYVIVHPHFDKPKKSNDIALIHTHRSIRFNHLVKAIECLGSPLPRDTLVTHTGWSWRKGKDEEKMRSAYHRVIPYSTCLTYFDKKVRNPIGPGHLCLNLPKDSDYCLKETGGLLMHHNKLAGLSSVGTPCAMGEPFIGTRISFYYDFIRTTMKGCVRCRPHQHFQVQFFDL